MSKGSNDSVTFKHFHHNMLLPVYVIILLSLLYIFKWLLLI